MIIASGRGQVSVIQLLLQHGAYPEDSTLIGIFEGKLKYPGLSIFCGVFEFIFIQSFFRFGEE
jgi:hypothetical protein